MKPLLYSILTLNLLNFCCSQAQAQKKSLTTEEVIAKIKYQDFSAQDLRIWSKKQEAEKLCLNLNQLLDSQLVYFETIVHELKCSKKLTDQLTNRLNLYHQKKRQVFKEIRENKLRPGVLTLRPAPPVYPRPELGSIDTSSSPVLVKADLPAGYVALTFDDGPHPTHTPKILQHLQRHSVKATFFPVGTNVLRQQSIFLDLVRDGHTYGSHTMTHPDLRQVSFLEAQNEILNALNLLTDVSGEEIRFFRFPYGATNSHLNQFVKEQRIAAFFWNIDSEDWRHRDPLKAYNQVIQQINQKRSGIILFHDIVAATEATVEALLEELEKKGYQVVLLRPNNREFAKEPL